MAGEKPTNYTTIANGEDNPIPVVILGEGYEGGAAGQTDGLKEGTDINGATMPTGGTSGRGWLSAIWKLISDRLPVLGVKTAAGSIPVTLSSDGAFSTNFGATTDAAASSDTGASSLLSLFKRLLSFTLAKGQAVMANSISVAIASNQTAVPISFPAGQLTPTFENKTASGTVAAGKYSVSFYNSGSAAGTLLGAPFPVGAGISYTPPQGTTLSAIAYDATGTTFLIGTL